jgi:hypothetical protein
MIYTGGKRRSVRRAVSAAVAIAGVVLLAGCGSSAGGAGTDGGGGPTVADSLAAAATGAGQSAAATPSTAADSIQALVAGYADGKPGISAPALSKRPPTGIKVDGVVCTLPTCVAEDEPVPYKALGWQYKAFDYDVTKGPAALTTAFENAIQDHPKYIVLQAVFPVATFQKQLTEATKAGIGIVALANPATSVPGTLGCVSCQNQRQSTGALQIDVAVADGGTSANILYVVDPSLGPLVATMNGAKAELAKIAPGNELHELNVSAGSPPSVSAAAVANYVQQHPDTGYLLFASVAIAGSVPQTLAQDGLADKVKIITQAPQETNLQQIAAGTEFASIASEDITTVWRCADIFARDSVGDPIPAELATPDGWHRVILKSNVATLDGKTPEAPNYQEIFEKAWLVQS